MTKYILLMVLNSFNFYDFDYQKRIVSSYQRYIVFKFSCFVIKFKVGALDAPTKNQRTNG